MAHQSIMKFNDRRAIYLNITFGQFLTALNSAVHRIVHFEKIQQS